MIEYFKRRIGLYFDPPKSGDSFFADPMDYFCESSSERIFYDGMIDRHGHNQWNFIVSNNTYRFTITSDAMPYYVCKVEILVSSVYDKNVKTWLKRTYPRRVWKKDFHNLIKDGRMVKTISQSLYRNGK